MDQQFARDVMQGLSTKPKFLSSKYFYDKTGDMLFQQIMELDEYYLTDCEYEIFQNEKKDLLSQFSDGDQPFDLIEFGAGDGQKTKVLLQYFLKQGKDFTYKPIDISENALAMLSHDLTLNFPDLKLETFRGEYFKVLSTLNPKTSRKKVILFLGSNIGNFLRPVAVEFLTKLRNSLHKGDKLLLGVDLVKDPHVIASAYNDKRGITRAFNMNLLTRINRELGADFDLDKFTHFPSYNPITGTARSFLVSNITQTVNIHHINASVRFEAYEPMHMEYSHKYRMAELKQLAKDSGFGIIKHYFDSREYFTNGLWQV